MFMPKNFFLFWKIVPNIMLFMCSADEIEIYFRIEAEKEEENEEEKKCHSDYCF